MTHGAVQPGSLARADVSMAALVLLGTRFVQGFIFWGGASWRLFYDFREIDGVDLALKLDFNAPGFVAAKLTHALPGTLWVQGPILATLAHPDAIVASVWLWTIVELAVGLALILGLMTRAAAFTSFWLNVTLMLIFGWMGSTCLDEWTMAVSGVAMSSALFVAGSGPYALDTYLGRTAWVQRNTWVNWIASGPLPEEALRKLGLALAAACVAFTVLSYQILFGAVVTPLHSRTNFHRHNIALSDVTVSREGAVQFSAYVDAGPDTGAAYVIAARLVDSSGATVASWDGATLATLPASAIRNAYPYAWAAHFKTETVGFSGQTGAHATITLPAVQESGVAGEPYELVLTAIDGTVWRAALVGS